MQITQQKNSDFSIWPLMVDMLTSVLIVFILFSFFDNLLAQEKFEQRIIEMRRSTFVGEFDREFAREITSRRVDRVPNFNFLQITFSEEVLFEPGSSSIGTDGMKIMSRLAPLIIAANDQGNIETIQIEGHTDDLPLTGRNQYPRDNWELSTARSIAVLKYLANYRRGRQKIDETLFSANGFGPNVPADPADPENRDKNRRIEIKVIYSAD